MLEAAQIIAEPAPTVKYEPWQIETFWAHVHKLGPDECWDYTNNLGGSNKAYGRVSWRGGEYAHRVAWKLTHNRPIPDGMCICHSCDWPRCVNPAHLWLGTIAENQQDMSKKGRCRRGDTCNLSKLTEATVIAIRKSYATGGVTYDTLATVHGVHKRTIARVVKRKIWRHIA